MKYRFVLASCALLASGCVVETRSRPRTAYAPDEQAPPPAVPVTTPVEEAPPLPPPTGVREYMPTHRFPRPIPRDPQEPPPVATPLPPQPPPEPPPRPAPRPVATLTGIAEGAPTFSPSSPPAYWIWHGRDGVWRVRTTDGNSLQKFGGRINIRTGNLSGIRISRVELERRMDVKGQTISFNYATNGQSEGVDFTVEEPNTCVMFSLGARPNKRIFVGARMIQPPDEDFLLCPPK